MIQVKAYKNAHAMENLTENHAGNFIIDSRRAMARNWIRPVRDRPIEKGGRGFSRRYVTTESKHLYGLKRMNERESIVLFVSILFSGASSNTAGMRCKVGGRSVKQKAHKSEIILYQTCAHTHVDEAIFRFCISSFVLVDQHRFLEPIS